MTSPAQYGELMAAAHRQALRARTHVQHMPLLNPRMAIEVLDARARLLDAVAHHAEIVLGPVRVATWTALRPVPPHTPSTNTPNTPNTVAVTDGGDRVPRAVVSWIRALRDTARTSPQGAPNETDYPDPSSAADGLRAARDLVRAASDLIATHRDPDGALRPGTPFPLAASDIGGLLTRALDIAIVMASTEPWAVRAREAGLPRTLLDRALPLDSPLLAQTRGLSQLLDDPGSAIDTVTVARPAIDTTDPALEWRLRTDRIRARLDQHAANGLVSARTLHDIASLALVVDHVLSTSHRHDPQQTVPVSDAARLVAHLAPLRSAEPADPVIRADVQRLLTIAHPGTAMPDGDRARLLGAIDASLPTVAAAQATANRLATALTDAWIPARRRPGYLRSPHPPGRAVQPAPTYPPVTVAGVQAAGLGLT